MIDNPICSNNIVVLVRIDGMYTWFLNEKTIWVMDYVSWGKMFGGDIQLPPERKDVPILTKETWEIFKNLHRDAIVSVDQLKELVISNLPIDSWEEKGELFPSLYLNFDDEVLYSVYPEYPLFDKYVSPGWKGNYGDFYELIPESEKYWVVDGIDYMPED